MSVLDLQGMSSPVQEMGLDGRHGHGASNLSVTLCGGTSGLSVLICR